MGLLSCQRKGARSICITVQLVWIGLQGTQVRLQSGAPKPKGVCGRLLASARLIVRVDPCTGVEPVVGGMAGLLAGQVAA